MIRYCEVSSLFESGYWPRSWCHFIIDAEIVIINISEYSPRWFLDYFSTVVNSAEMFGFH